ncbi:hypothetical protein H0G86_005650 [Trichoderma simmonsii]|uniref:Uncharacterized protein n=1 Tax=Trichoderma simmonsii TaxID=1491479 RepID=A0A8G0LA78_9HYPO|nr:hypothetical protein H0G86_005650 [Trichoderma simmonsii]
MPLLFNQSAHPQKILLRPVSAADHVTCHLRIPSSPKEPPLSPSLICSTTRLESPQMGAISFRMGIASRPRQNHPPEISSRPCMAYLSAYMINIRVDSAIDRDRQPSVFNLF